MSSKPLKQNLNAVTGKRVIRHPSEIAANKRRDLSKAIEESQKQDAHIRNLEGEVSVKENEVLQYKQSCENLTLENAMLRREIEKLRKQLDEKKRTTGEVTEGDLKLRSKPSVAKKLPRD